MPRLANSLLAILVLTILAFGAGSTQLPAQGAAAPDAARLRALFFQRDYETAIIEGSRAASLEPEARAWHLLNMTRGGREKDAIAAAQKMVAELPANGWSSFALSAVRHYETEHADEAIALSQKALELLPGNSDALWLRATTLAGDAKRRDEAISFVDAKLTETRNKTQLLNVKAYALYSQSFGRTRDEAKLKAAIDTYAEARKLDPSNLDATFLPGTYLSGLRRGDEAFPLLAAAAKMSPSATSVQAAYWRALNASTAVPAAEKLAQLQSMVDTFVAARRDRPGALRNAASMYKELKLPAKQRELEDLILDKFSDTIDAEWILAERWRDQQAKGPDQPASPEFRKTLVTYLERPRYFHEGLLGEAYRNMFHDLVTDKSTKPEYLQRIVDGMVKYETMNVHIVHASAPIAMAENKILLDTAEKIARNSPEVMIKKVDSQRELYDGEAAYDKAKRSMVALGYDALGWVLFAKNNMKEAEKELLRSYDLNHENRLNLFHLGKFYEETKDLTKAEEFYVKGLAMSALGVNPSEAALKRLFEARKDAKGTFEEYIAGLREADRGRRLTKIMGERSVEPKAAPAFNLKTIDGKMVSLESLKGKVVAINFWGIWCGWCVHELPDLQKLYEQYKNDPDVVIITIDNDQNPNEVAPWMAQKNYTFPVLLDDGFVNKAGIQAFPTTWFLDRDGKLAFTKVGWSEKLIEEFGWRIEAIKKKVAADR